MLLHTYMLERLTEYHMYVNHHSSDLPLWYPYCTLQFTVYALLKISMLTFYLIWLGLKLRYRPHSYISLFSLDSPSKSPNHCFSNPRFLGSFMSAYYIRTSFVAVSPAFLRSPWQSLAPGVSVQCFLTFWERWAES